MTETMHVLIIGGGITGLTLANLLIHGKKQFKVQITLFETRPEHHQDSLGGGIGLWPPSQAVLQTIPGYVHFIEHYGFIMPSPSYRDSQGRYLAKAPRDFSSRFPIQCLHRQDLVNTLLDALKNSADIQIINGQKIRYYERQGDKIVIEHNGIHYVGDVLIGCDGIHSQIRNCLMAELQLPPVYPTALSYTYFRANTQLPQDSSPNWWSSSFELWGKSESELYGHHILRFGYVPLRPPGVFWFIAIETQQAHPYLSPINTVQLVDEKTKQFLLNLVQAWQPIRNEEQAVLVDIAQLLKLTKHILRTDIEKMAGIERFPWTSKDNRIVLMGDAAHATAPNLAQGAGLCIEDAACFVSKLDRVDYLQGINDYAKERKPRALTVQKLADSIATLGQIKNPLVRALRDFLMQGATLLAPNLQQRIFEYVVSKSLGGSRKAIYWQIPPNIVRDAASTTLFARVFANYVWLEDHIKQFKTAKIAMDGIGEVSVKRAKFLSPLLKILGLPPEMESQPFYAEVMNVAPDIQCWRRVFGYQTPQQKTYTTTHSLYCDFNRQIYLSESVGGLFDKLFQFIYTISQENNRLNNQSCGLVFYNLFKIPLPQFLLPKSSWEEKPCEKGWLFEGKISLPLLGTIVHYYGRFTINYPLPAPPKRIIVAGGSGMIGRTVCLAFLKKGYEVYCLSRFLTTKINIEGIRLRLIDEDWSDLIDKNTIIINLSGENPGAKRWSSSFKLKIAESRYAIIHRIIENIARAKHKPLKYLQASAAGYYGDAGAQLLSEESRPVVNEEKGSLFRIKVCEEIEQRASQAPCDVINLRIGHVLSQQGGLLPYFKLASFFLITKLGSGKQYIPFVHSDDLSQAITFIADSKTLRNGAVNITAPLPCQSAELLSELAWCKLISGFSLPKSLLKLLIGDAYVVLTDSERVEPTRLLAQGFNFNYKTIKEALNGLN
ncbi:DUF1731 domain-containing protein [Legionella sp. km772]|uniref:DUF1731 domain-containing protein n=1 Tax=Legionella sp. km772 TaxID=2498111 RepID=UPI000F8E01F0|nr:DUF1731 domain-containing protein [Legionella sp. km772]RUR07524.1 DUF1731 domain-containing protein [Legionella sp. km772]